MSAGTGRTLIQIESVPDVELRVALALEKGNNILLQYTVRHQANVIEELQRVIGRLNSRSSS